MSDGGAKLLVVGIDGMDYDVLARLADQVPTLAALARGSCPHASVHPPDSVPSWTTILTGRPPEVHGQLKNANFMLDGDGATTDASVAQWPDECFWEFARGSDIAILNPFLAYPPWSPRGDGAMVSAPPFAERPPEVSDPRGLLVGEPPRMGGFSTVPAPAELPGFVADTLQTGQRQFEYALRQLGSRRWDLMFVTSLVLDRLKHYTWRFFDPDDPNHVTGSDLADAIPAAYRQVESFVTEAMRQLQPDDQLVVLSDHGHARRAYIGVNANEHLRRLGLYSTASVGGKRRMIEAAKTWVISGLGYAGAGELAIRLGRRVPNRQALKSGTHIGKIRGAAVTDLAGSNPFGGIALDGTVDPGVVIRSLLDLKYRGRPVMRWCRPAAEVLLTGSDARSLYPDLLFEMEPEFGPTFNLFGPLFAPIVTHKRQSGGHTQRGVFFSNRPLPGTAPSNSLDVARTLRLLAGQT